MSKNNSTTSLNLDFKELNVLVCREIARGKFLAVPNSMSDHHSHLSTTQQDQDYNIYVCGGIDRNASIASEIESLYRVNAINNSDITKEIYLIQNYTLIRECTISSNFDDIEFGNSITFGSHLYNYKYGTLKRLVHNKIPIHLLVSNAVLGNSVRPFLHCYVNEKDGRKMGVFVANNRLLYLLNLDYMNPRFCFRFADTTMKDQLRTLCDITIRTGAASLEHYVVDKQLGMLPQQVHAQPGNAQHGTNGKKRKSTNKNDCELQ
ncbi:hypothetical protein C9374_010366 [Naegleria lovaniensis]|uniref:Uncharacterized protein n=1 Tax=Naegleria lovaniensis TaxID=51637 RepID=A0AA88KJK4_NAELO|nr:uncharacterized protein C9374_010366 [Naegleria lovaniensis]KAG2374992.1 hypothetical protein C9374_010366 [Naegleria lovaniensis]